MNLSQKIRDTETKLRSMSDPMKQLDSWQLLERLLGRMPVDQSELARIIKERDAIGLDDMIRRLEDPEAFQTKEEPLPEFTQSELNDALRAFRHRIKFKKLDDESKISQRNLTGGKKAQIDSMQPPGASEFDPLIWKVLVKEGRLVYDGQGFYHEPPARGELKLD
ncbi:MAG: hypothetical protein JJ974_10345 [Phycisphaerales bacterium]|nr:hypothetical protein [Phycisphaerales bacterium]